MVQSKERWGEARRKGGGLHFLVGSDIQQIRRFKILGMSESAILIPIKNILGSVLGLNTVIILKRVREYIFFQSNKCSYSMVRLEIEKGWENL